MTRPPARSAPEHVKARWWRVEVMGLTREQLAPRLGLTVSTIADYEAGKRRSTGEPIGANDMRRYRLACAALTADLEAWDWTRLD